MSSALTIQKGVPVPPLTKIETCGYVRYPELQSLRPGGEVLIVVMSRNRGQALALNWRRSYPGRDYRATTVQSGVVITRHA